MIDGREMELHGGPVRVGSRGEGGGSTFTVVGSHGYTGLKRWLLGSVAQSVVSHAPCPVEVVRRERAETVSMPRTG